MAVASFNFISVDQAMKLVTEALRTPPASVIPQHLTESGNAVFRAVLPQGQSVVIRISPNPAAYRYTGQNLAALRELGLPVQEILASGPTAGGGSFSILSWLTGRDLLYELPAMDTRQMTTVAESVVGMQKRAGTLPMSRGFGWAPVGKSASVQHWTDIFGPAQTGPIVASPIVTGEGMLGQLKTRLQLLRQSVEPYFATIKPTCFLDDLTIKNVLVHQGAVSGIIDVDSVCYGDPLMSVGTTLALLAAEVGSAGDFYRNELLRCWQPTEEQTRAIHFYTALWTVGMLNAAENAGDAERVARLAETANLVLQLTESPHISRSLVTDPEKLLASATDQHRAGNLPAARGLYQQVLTLAPDHEVAQFRLGLLEMQRGNLEPASKLMQRAAQKSPGEYRYQFGLGEVFTAMNRWSEAMVAYRTAAAIDPQSADAWNGIGHCEQRLERLDKAQSAYENALKIQPDHASAMSNLATILQTRGEIDKAIELLHKARALEPDQANHSINLGAALCQKRQFDLAVSVLSDAVETNPGNADARFNLANALRGAGQHRAAVEQLEQAIALRPDQAHAFNNLGTIYKELGKLNRAESAYLSAIRIDPQSTAAINNLGCLLRTMGRLEEAETVLRGGLARDAKHPALHDNLGNVLKDSGRLDEAIDCFRQSLLLDPTSSATHSNLLYSLSFLATQPQTILDEARRWNAMHVLPLKLPACSCSNDPSPNRRLRIGYVSPDFRDHCQSLFTIPLLSHHDHSQFEIFCYSSVERPDARTARIASFADVWREVRSMDDSALCGQIRADQIDILIDLTMHMADSRPIVFAHRPAPIQIAWLAYPGTTGIQTMDYRLSDPRLDPPGSDNYYTECTIRLPDSFWCYDPLTTEPAVNDLPALSRGYLTLGCLNNPCKLTDHTLHLWAKVMRQLPEAKLLLMAAPGSARQNLLARAAAQHITAERIEFVSFRPRRDYLQSYHAIDLGLDSFPYNGHTTSLDSMWMGVPVVTRVGNTCVGRAGLSQLHQLELTELAAETDADFVEIAVQLGRDLPRLAELRKQLRSRLSNSPLMDGARFAGHIEAVYRQLWQDRVNRPGSLT